MFNALNSIHSFILTNDSENAAAYLEKFSRLMRLILENSTQASVTLADDLKALELYLELEAERLDNKFNYEINIDKNINANEVFVPPLIFQPFIENSVWHGMTTKEKDGKIELHISSTAKILKCVISDNGNGFKKSSNASRSYGLSITRQRIENLNRIQKTNAYFNLSEIKDNNNFPKGVKVELGLPLVTSGT
jgi:LytS/YehU family sensor histidine kinase